MARYLRPQLDDASLYRGLDWIFEYTNEDGALSTWNCGQAAAATFLTHQGKMDPVQAAQNMAWLEAHHPPDQLFGWFGTGRRRLERIIRSFGLDLIEVRGREAIERELDRRNPVILMLGMPGPKLLGATFPAGTGWWRSAMMARAFISPTVGR